MNHMIRFIPYVQKITNPFGIEVLRVKRMHRNWKSWFLSQGHQLFRLEMNKYYLTFLIKPFRIKNIHLKIRPKWSCFRFINYKNVKLLDFKREKKLKRNFRQLWDWLRPGSRQARTNLALGEPLMAEVLLVQIHWF